MRTELTTHPGIGEIQIEFVRSILHSGPLSMLLFLLFLVSLPVAIFSIVRRVQLPWMLLSSCLPFIFGSAAAHFGLITEFMTLNGDFMLPAKLSEKFHFNLALFNRASATTVVFIAASLIRSKCCTRTTAPAPGTRVSDFRPDT